MKKILAQQHQQRVSLEPHQRETHTKEQIHRFDHIIRKIPDCITRIVESSKAQEAVVGQRIPQELEQCNNNCKKTCKKSYALKGLVEKICSIR